MDLVKRTIHLVFSLWKNIILFRCLWVFAPQNGYIHPDEYFQSVEVVAGDVYRLKVLRTWEFNPEKPIRSTLIPSVLYGPAFLLLQYFNTCPWMNAGNMFTTYSLLITPRIAVAFLGIILDLMVFKLMKMFPRFDVDSGMMMYVTSYITLVYYTRTLSNTIEAFLFVLLLLTIQNDAQRYIRQVRLNPRTRFTEVSKQYHPLDEATHISIKETVLVSLCLVAGTFNRPTFLIFAFVPYLYWIFDGFLPQSIGELLDDTRLRLAFLKIKFTAIFCVLPFFIFVIWDSLYYHSMRLINTPLNFISYNSKEENLAEHGKHSRFVHLFVNLPLLFGPAFVLIFYDLFTYIVTKGKFNLWRRTSLIALTDTKFWIHCFIFPVLALSFFPHQEPRFLIPLYVPVVILYSHLFFGPRCKRIFQVVWILFNLIAAYFYGFLHQGQLINSIEFVKQQVLSQPDVKENYVVFSHTYMPPRYLFNIESDENVNSQSLAKFTNQKLMIHHPIEYIAPELLQIIDFQGDEISKLKDEIHTFRMFKIVQNDSQWRTKIKTFLVAPSSIDSYICNKTENSVFSLDFKFITQFHGHVTMEHLPSVEDFMRAYDGSFPMSECDRVDGKTMEYGIFNSFFTLNVYEIF